MRKFLLYSPISIILFIFLLAVSITARDGEIDLTFSVKIGSTAGSVKKIKVQPDGKILAAGDIPLLPSGNAQSDYRPNLVRFQSDGTQDYTFNPVFPKKNLNGEEYPANINEITLQSDGRILIGGDFKKINGIEVRGIARLNTDGTLDNTFTPNVSQANPNLTYSINAIEIYPNGKILIGGTFDYIFDGRFNYQKIARLNPNGSIDLTFSQFPFDPNQFVNVYDLRLKNDGMILVCSDYRTNGNQGYLMRLNSDGTLDNSFHIPTIQTTVSEFTFEVQSDGKILLGGVFSSVNGLPFTNIVRFNSNGDVDSSFNANDSPGNPLAPKKILFLDNNKILVARGISVIHQLNENGTLDQEFQTERLFESPQDLALSNDGQILVGNQASFEGISGDGVLSSGYALEKITRTGNTYPNFILSIAQPATIQKIIPLPNGKLYVVGDFSTIDGIRRNMIARLNTDGSLDRSFDFTHFKHLITSLPSNYPIDLLSNGQIVACFNNRWGFSNTTNTVIINTDGSVGVEIPDSSNLRSLKVLSGDDILISHRKVDNGFGTFALSKIRANGTFDDGYDVRANNYINTIAQQSDGKVLIAGKFTTVQGQGNSMRIARLAGNGSIDSAFDAFADDEIHGLAVRNDGRIVITGFFRLVNYENHNQIALLESNGGPSPGFRAETHFSANKVISLPNGKILIGGSDLLTVNNISRRYIARLFKDGILDSGLNVNSNNSTTGILGDFAVQSDGKILAGGLSTFDSKIVNSLIRLKNLDSFNTPRSVYDFDGDGKADISVFRPSNGVWYLQQSTSGFAGVAFGAADDIITPADFDGDGRTDIAVFRQSNGAWYLLGSQTGFTGFAFGQNGDIPVPADYDGDGKADIAVFRPSNGVWYIQGSQSGFSGVAFGATGDVPVTADYDGDGKADVAVFRPSNGTWYIQRSQLGFIGVLFGDSADKPVPADYDGDGKTDISVYRPSNGVWYLQQSTAGFAGIAFGFAEDLPVPADYDGDGKADVAVFRPSNGVWYLNRTTSGFTGILFGASGDKPAPNAYIR